MRWRWVLFLNILTYIYITKPDGLIKEVGIERQEERERERERGGGAGEGKS